MVQIAAAEAERNKLAAVVNLRHTAAIQIEAAINSASHALAAAGPALADVLNRDAMGEAGEGEVADARALIATAEKALATARKREPEARDHATVERGLSARVADLDVKLTELRQLHKAEAVEGLRAELSQRIAAYLRSAELTIRRFSEVLALDGYLTGIGHAPDIRTPETAHILLPGFRGHAAKPLDFNMLLAAETARLTATHGLTRDQSAAQTSMPAAVRGY